jgi:hypothetical protein
MHQRLLSPSKIPTSVALIPACLEYITPDSPWWDTPLKLFPEGYQACNALITERIPPFSKPAREMLIDRFCPPHLCEQIKASEPDRDCIVRLYLGRRRLPRPSKRPSHFSTFSLRNFPLHVDQVEELGLDAKRYARAMAEVLACCYFAAQIDAADVEFVLAPPRARPSLEKPSESEAESDAAPREDEEDGIFKSETLGPHALWILDFDCCRPISLTEQGMTKAVDAFWGNDPYFPRPGRTDPKDVKLWSVFRGRFLEVGKEILGAREDEDVDARKLPGLWVEMCESLGAGRAASLPTKNGE